MAPVAYLLWTRHLRHNPTNPEWSNRDRFVLSAGHASMLIYSLLHLTGYDLPLEQIRNFRQWGSMTPGHPERGHTPGVETTTGPLGQGVANSVGMALAERWLADRFNRPGHAVVDHHTYAVCSDGDLMEGISHEAADFAGHQLLGKLIWVFDDNRVTIDGGTELSCSTDHEQRFRGYGWEVRRVDDGNDLAALDAALEEARAETDRPSLVMVRTTIGYGSPGKAGSSSVARCAAGRLRRWARPNATSATPRPTPSMWRRKRWRTGGRRRRAGRGWRRAGTSAGRRTRRLTPPRPRSWRRR